MVSKKGHFSVLYRASLLSSKADMNEWFYQSPFLVSHDFDRVISTLSFANEVADILKSWIILYPNNVFIEDAQQCCKRNIQLLLFRDFCRTASYRLQLFQQDGRGLHQQEVRGKGEVGFNSYGFGRRFLLKLEWPWLPLLWISISQNLLIVT